MACDQDKFKYVFSNGHRRVDVSTDRRMGKDEIADYLKALGPGFTFHMESINNDKARC